jgi:hypothetical protein
MWFDWLKVFEEFHPRLYHTGVVFRRGLFSVVFCSMMGSTNENEIRTPLLSSPWRLDWLDQHNGLCNLA